MTGEIQYNSGARERTVGSAAWENANDESGRHRRKPTAGQTLLYMQDHVPELLKL